METTKNSTSFNQNEVDKVLNTLQNSFRECREFVLQNVGTSTYSNKQDGTPVTAIDIEVERIIMSELSNKFPSTSVFGEEGGIPDELPENYWLLDPIDGTKSYIRNIPAFTAMAVCIIKGKTVASVIYNYQHDDMYVARLGMGAYKNGTKLDLQKNPLPEKAYCRERMVSGVKKLLEHNVVQIESGPSGGGYGFSLVSDGTLAARFNFPHSPGRGFVHDYAPGALLVSEAGGSIISVEHKGYTYKTRSFVACHPYFAQYIEPIVNDLRQLEIDTAK